MEELLREFLTASVKVAVFVLGTPLLFAALRWVARKQKVFICADRRLAVRAGLVLLACICLTAVPKSDRECGVHVPNLGPARAVRSTEEVGTSATNLSFTALSVQSGRIVLGLTWNADLFMPGRVLGLYASTNLVDGWFRLDDVAVGAGATNALVELDRADLPPAAAAFFRAGTYRDSDGDGLADVYERLVSRTDPLRADTDGDGLSDYDEIHGTTPSDPLAADTDGDGVPDGVEAAAGTDPRSPDTDGDGLDDLAEMTRHGTDPTRRDTDGDGLDDSDEIRRGTDPKAPDTDFDDLPDG